MSTSYRRALPVYPVFEDKKSKALDKKLVTGKSHKTDRTNIIAKLRLRAINQMIVLKVCSVKKLHNIADRLPENSHNSFVDLQSRKKSKKTPKIDFSLKDEIIYFD